MNRLSPFFLKNQLAAIFILFLLLPTLLLGFIGYRHIADGIKAEKINAVSQVADIKRDQLHFMLVRAYRRATQFVSNLKNHCSDSTGAYADRCLHKTLHLFVENEFALGAHLSMPDKGRSISVGYAAVRLIGSKPLLPDQLADITKPDPAGNRLYYIVVTDPQAQYQLVITYPIRLIQEIFESTPALGQSGEVFLADSAGYFVTPSRYPSSQGRTKPISARPMRQCLASVDAAMLDLDFRDVPIIHGFRYIPWIGGGCIMAHIDQAEAFAPLQQFRWQTFFITLLFSGMGIAVSIWFSRKIITPLSDLLQTTRKIINGNYAAQIAISGNNEVTELSRSFNLMTARLRSSFELLNTSQTRLEEQVLERTAALKESEERQLAIFNAAPDAMVISDMQGIILMANQQIEALLGYTVNELIGQNIELLVPERLRTEHVAQRAKYIADPRLRLMGTEAQARCKNGHYVDIEISLSPITTEKGLLFVSALRNITLRKQADAALRESRERFDLAVRGAKDAVWDWNLLTSEVFVSDLFYEMLGYQPHEISLTIPVWESLLHADDHDITLAKLHRHLQQREPYDTEYRLRTQTGDYRWFLARGQAVWNEQGQATRISGFMSDITERKKTQQLLEDKERMLSESQRIAQIGSWSVDLTSEKIAWSEEACRIIGVDPHGSTLTLKTLIDLIHPDDKASMQTWISDCRQGKKPEAIDFRILLANGDIRFIRGSGELQCDAAGQPVRMAGTAQEITERKRIEKDLIKAMDKAEAANRAKSEFLANMSHEIRTPLNAILGLIYLVLDTPLLPQQKGALKKVYASSKALLSILNDILDYSKIEAGRLEIERLPLRTETLFKNIADLFGMQVESKGLELFLDIGADVPTEVLGDGLRLTQVLNNLVSNAIKFTERGEISISVTLGGNDGGENITLCFAVHDTGIGLSQEQIKQLFQPFSQANETITRKYGGTGLGLAISQRLVRLMGGDITISSVEGQGSTFSFCTQVGLVPTAITHRDLEHLKHLKILVVDDYATARLLLKRLLESWGLEVYTAASGEEALTCINEVQSGLHPFDIVLLDSHMPHMSGLDVVHQLVEDAAIKQLDHPLKVIMVTAFQEEAEDLLAQTDLVYLDGILAKPITPSALYNALSSVRDWGKAGRMGINGKMKSSAILRFDGAHVLLVEDNAINQEVASAILKKHGLVVTLANHGGEALEQVQHQSFDAVLMDLHMPIMDGFEAARCLRELPQGQQLPIIAMTAAVMQEDRERCSAIGMVDFIAKPIEPDELLNVLKKWLPANYATVQALSAKELESEARSPSDLPYKLPGFDLGIALRRLGGDSQLLTRLLLNFAEEQSGLLAQLDALLADGNVPQAVAMLHTLKGVADNLGATTLAQVASQLEHEIHAGGQRSSQSAFSAILETVLTSIRRHVRPSVVTAGLAIDQQAVAHLLSDLTPFLQQRKLVPDELMQTLQRLSQADLPGAPLAHLLHQLDQIDHEGALKSISEIAAALVLK